LLRPASGSGTRCRPTTEPSPPCARPPPSSRTKPSWLLLRTFPAVGEQASMSVMDGLRE
jgi:hypothetical protein